MTAENDKPWVRTHIPLRLFGALIWLLGLTLFCMLAYVGIISFFRDGFELNLERVILFVRHVVLISGFVPLVTLGFLLIFFKSDGEFFYSLFIFTPIFVVLHYVVVVFSAHSSDVIYLTIQAMEIILAVSVVTTRVRRWRRNT